MFFTELSRYYLQSRTEEYRILCRIRMKMSTYRRYLFTGSAELLDSSTSFMIEWFENDREDNLHMDINQKLTEELGVKRWQVDAAVKLIDEGNTIPFISRYRKEVTGSLNDEQLRKLYERLIYLRNLEEKKEQVISSIEEQGKMTEELRHQILAAETQVTVEDLYRPYRPKRRTRATIAKEKGLEPLAAFIMLQNAKEPLENTAKQYISEEKGVKSAADAIAGAKDIIAESISDNADYRNWIRKTTMRKGKVASTAKDPEAESVYEMYYEFEEPVSKLAGHRILALNRGEKEKFLTVKVEAPEEDILRYLEKKTIHKDNPYTAPVLKETVEDSYHRLIAPAIEREIRNELTEKAEDGAIEVFGKNLHQLLMQPPIAGKVVLGWDPAFRTGCKLAVVDPTGKVIGTTVIYPTAPTTPQKIKASKDLLKKIIPKYHISLISLGNGTASRESEQIIVDLLKEKEMRLSLVESCTGGALAARIVNVPGASDVFGAGFVTYSNKAKRKMVQVKKSTLKTVGAVSERCASEMARGGANVSGADVCLSVTGIAGPGGGTKEKPVGTVFMGCCCHGETHVREFHFVGSRSKIREQSVSHGLAFLRECIMAKSGE